MSALPPEAHDFDFLFGRWTVANRRQKVRAPGAGADPANWDEFSATALTEPRLGGLVNVDELSCPERGWRGMAVRSFDIAAGEWAIWWIADRDGRLQLPVRGRFHEDGCRLEGPDEVEGLPVIARYEWSRVSSGQPRWEQSFSFDGGRTFELDWTMEFTRTDA